MSNFALADAILVGSIAEIVQHKGLAGVPVGFVHWIERALDLKPLVCAGGPNLLHKGGPWI
jgi:hypothetical protein